MGQGYSLPSLPTDAGAINIPELSDLSYEKTLGGARFLRTVRARHHDGIVLAKVCMKSNSSVRFGKYVRALLSERKALSDIPNVLPYQRIVETNTHGFLARQYMHSSLYDRMSIRPFLENIEKKWIAYQLLCAVRDCHSRNVYHGDIKTENVLVTSWGWVYVTDFSSSFKPVYLPEDNPADFSFYFDTSARRTCYLAPERFYAPGQRPQEENSVQWSMDVFSLGCVIAELFTESPTFTLSQLFKYRTGDYDPTLVLLNKIDDDHIRNLITSMIKLNPEERWHAQDYLDEYKDKAFPLYFYQHLHTFMQEITDPSSGQKRVIKSEFNNGESDDRIERIYRDFETLSVSLGYEQSRSPQNLTIIKSTSHASSLFPLEVDIPNNRHTAEADTRHDSDNGTFILLNVVVSSLRSTARAASRVHACELLLAFAERLPDEAKLDRVLPYLTPLLDDDTEMVQVAALRSITQLLALVNVVSPVNAFLFPQYLLQKLQGLVKTSRFRQSPTLRVTYATCLASLAQSAFRFLDMMQALRADGSLPSASSGTEDEVAAYTAYQNLYDATREDLVDQFEAQTKVFLTDQDTSVRRAFLGSVSSLCVFFGDSKASDVILSHLNTYLNDPDWVLKCAFFQAVVGIAVYIGGASLEEFVLPLMVQALTDPQEFVVEQALRSLASMAELGLLQRAKTWELVDVVGGFTMHPNLWIREAATHFVSATTTYLSMADVRILVTPIVKPYVKIPIGATSEAELLDALRKPIPRAVLDLALAWAAKTDNGLFWKSAQQSRQLSYRPTVSALPPAFHDQASFRSLSKTPKDEEDEQWLGRLKNSGMRSEDEAKIIALREYLWRAAQRHKRDNGPDPPQEYDEIVSLTKLKIKPQTIFFDDDLQFYQENRAEFGDRSGPDSSNRTIAEALLDATEPSQTDFAKTDQLTDAVPSVSSIGGLPVLSRRESPQHGSRDGRSPLPIITTTKTRSSGSGQSLSSSPSSGMGLMGKDRELHVRHRASAMGLSKGFNSGNKAIAEVATDETTAAGRLDTPLIRSRRTSPSPVSPQTRANKNRQASRSHAAHSYIGNDPAVLKLLDTVYLSNYPLEAADFGPLIQPIKRGPIPFSGPQPPSTRWRPQGQLVGILGEHSGPVRRIVVAPDHLFFLTASDDGSVKVWDSSRLERNVTHRSRQTRRQGEGVRVTSLCFVESTHTFVSTGSDGSVNIVKVEVTLSGETTRYGKARLLRDWQIPSLNTLGEHAVWSEHFRAENASILMLATNLCRILAVDLRDMSVIYDLHNPIQHGQPTCFCVSRNREWLLLGTSHGVLDLWDLRFRLRLRSWTFPRAVPISRIRLHPRQKGAHRHRVCVSGGTAAGEVSTWDIEKVICHEVLRPSHASGKERTHIRDYELKSLDEDRPEGVLTRVSGSVALDPTISESSSATATAVMPFVVAMHAPDDNSEPRHAFFITGGPDWKLRFWDVDRLEGCKIVNGATSDEKPSYMYSPLGLDAKIITEKLRAPIMQEGESKSEANRVASGTSKRGTPSAAVKTARYETIRLSAQHLLDGHLDTVLDVALLERPFGMILSSDQSGQVYVYQ